MTELNYQTVELSELYLSKLNVRNKAKTNLDDLLSSIKSLGILQPLIVKKRVKKKGYEVVAGQRRFLALKELSKSGYDKPVPVMIAKNMSDVQAFEASLSENTVRLDMTDVEEFRAFSELSNKGLTADQIANKFGKPRLYVERRLALGNLLPEILNLYEEEKLEFSELKHLTLADEEKQKTWLKLYTDGDDYPCGYQLKDWLLGGDEITLDKAIFDIALYKAPIVNDLFKEESYFSDSVAFWLLQNKAIADLKEKYESDGWKNVFVSEKTNYFGMHEYTECSKQDGGEIVIVVFNDGTIKINEGFIEKSKIKDVASGDGEVLNEEPKRAELTANMQNYIELHRHSSVRAELLNHPKIAKRLALAQMIVGSDLWTVQACSQNAKSDEISESLSTNKSEKIFTDELIQIKTLLGLDGNEDQTLVKRKNEWVAKFDFDELFGLLLKLNENEIEKVQTFVVAETLACYSPKVEVLGNLFNVKMVDSWHPDEIFFKLMKDKTAINSMIAEVGSEDIAKSQISETAKDQKAILQEQISLSKDVWLPKYMNFPKETYVNDYKIDHIDVWPTKKEIYK